MLKLEVNIKVGKIKRVELSFLFFQTRKDMPSTDDIIER